MIATATRYLLKYGYSERNDIKYFLYYDTLTLVINGKEYEAIVLDSCGAAMKSHIIDLFVAGSDYSITTNITIEFDN